MLVEGRGLFPAQEGTAAINTNIPAKNNTETRFISDPPKKSGY
jgi:hypothetical protein